MTLQVHRQHRVQFFLTHIEDHAVAQDAGVVDDDIEPAEGIDGLLDHLLAGGEVGHVGVVGGRLAAGLLDLRDDLLCRRLLAAFAGGCAAEVVDDDGRAFRREQQRLALTDTAAGARHDRHAVLQSISQWSPPSESLSVVTQRHPRADAKLSKPIIGLDASGEGPG